MQNQVHGKWKKGVSPIIATLLLLIIAVAASVLVYAFVSGYFGLNTQPMGSMVIDTYNIPAGSESIVAYVRNIGTKTLNVSNAYIDNQGSFINARIIQPGIVVRFLIPFPSGFNSAAGSTHSIKMVATDGTPAEISFTMTVVPIITNQNHLPISITDNSQFASSDAVSSGSGAQDDPYIINNWIIDASGMSGIAIQNTNAYFSITNCIIGNGEKGIYLYNVTNAKIQNCTMLNNDYGLYLSHSFANTIENSSMNDNYWCGLNFYNSSNTSILYSLLYDNGYYGIYSGSSIGTSIHYSSIYGNSYDVLNLESDPAFVINATQCYWAYNMPGNDSISPNVDYTPWLIAP